MSAHCVVKSRSTRTSLDNDFSVEAYWDPASSRVVAYLVENAGIWFAAYLGTLVPPPGVGAAWLTIWLYFALVGNVVVEAIIWFQHLAANTLYADIQRFKAGGTAPAGGWQRGIWEYATMFLPANVGAAGGFSLLGPK